MFLGHVVLHRKMIAVIHFSAKETSVTNLGEMLKILKH